MSSESPGPPVADTSPDFPWLMVVWAIGLGVALGVWRESWSAGAGLTAVLLVLGVRLHWKSNEGVEVTPDALFIYTRGGRTVTRIAPEEIRAIYAGTRGYTLALSGLRELSVPVSAETADWFGRHGLVVQTYTDRRL